MTKPKWDWKCLLPRDTFYRLQLDGFPGWQKKCGEPHFAKIKCIKGRKDSRDIAVAFDDIACFQFYYRDWTESGLPFAEDKETYWAGFWFQTKDDAVSFYKLCRRSNAKLLCQDAELDSIEEG